MQAPVSKSTRALKECAEWLTTCLRLGWAKSDLDDLERLWWEYHDDYGKETLPQQHLLTQKMKESQ